MKSCTLCPRRCGVDRVYQKGFCCIGMEPVVATAFPHFGEEPCISGTRGSGTIFFSGCNLHCTFCQNRPISLDGVGQRMTVPELADVMTALVEKGVHNLNLVTPTHQAHAISDAFDCLLQRDAWPNVPVVWNSGGYDAVETVNRMSRWVQVWMPDLKFHDAALSSRLAGAADYFEQATAAIRAMARVAGPAIYDGEGLMQKGLMIRHLILPGHTRDSIRVLEWVVAEFGQEVPVSLLSQYTPMPDAPGAPERRLTRREQDRVQGALFRLGLENGFVQDRAAAGTEMIPDWDGANRGE